jgi:hypothetical protein
MKVGKLLVVISGVLLALNQVGGWSQEKLVVTADDMYFGTWTNESLYIQESVNFLGGYEDYAKISSEKPYAEGTEQIVKKWTDSDGNVWYHAFGTVTSGSYAGFRFHPRLPGTST